jgi:nucleotide-binding universal stress UspA family protein
MADSAKQAIWDKRRCPMTATQLVNPAAPATMTGSATKPILFGTDFSPASEAALRKAIEMARKERAELIIAHVYEPPAGMSYSGAADEFFQADTEEKLRTAAKKGLEPAIARARAAGVRVRGVAVAGHASHRLADLARENGAALLVVGTHGRTGIKKLLTGSVASSLIATAPCPVLTVR